ncbi:class I SAM-dependent methyltransferase [Maritimibacter fusiformis]|uniref:Class I SAM-dependent methyltransferase n=1 Tax=Maritimibacter fusiformis TaxID=2603819 RepID=A0A5D0RMX6_9RHOB|nr:class I SAM-dependent methyltransferase [Maritimibacter fusiformis]TYB82296.1 class I SAM-dependent methyltransferase [Maritimibacter fusiformis]
MQATTRALWDKQDQHKGDRARLFAAVAGAVAARRVLYPGCFVDIAASFAFPDVTYADIDKRAAAFFADTEGTAGIIAENGIDPATRRVRFIHADYNALDLPEQGFDLLISLYAGFVSEACTRFLKPGGTLLVNPSHGDAAMAALDARYRLSGAVLSGGGGYRVPHDRLDRFLVPKKPTPISRESLHASNRGVAYTVPAFAYLFERIA